MRYLFRGLIRENGKAVVGHVESASPEEAFNALSDNGIVTESLTPDPKPQSFAPRNEPANPFADAIDSAFDTAASQIEFDDLTDRYRGKKVWVIDRDKIRRRVAQVVDQAITQAGTGGGDAAALRETVAKAIEGLFKDNANITSPAHQVAARQQQARLDGEGDPATVAVASSPALDAQVNRLAGLITQAQGVLASISAAARGIGSGGGGGGGGGPRRSFKRASTMKPQNDVLLEIFKSNMALQRGVTVEAPPAPAPVEDAGKTTEPSASEEPSPVAAESP